MVRGHHAGMAVLVALALLFAVGQPASAQAQDCQSPLAEDATADDYVRRARACLAVVRSFSHIEPEVVLRLTLESANAALALEPDNAEAYAIRGQIRLLTGARGQAIADYTLALHHDPALVEAYLGRALVMQAVNDHGGALADYDAAVRQAPDSTSALSARGLYYFQREHWDDALADFEAVVALDAQNADAYRYIGEIYDATGQPALALAAFEQHLAVAVSPSPAVNARVMLLRRSPEE